MFRLIERSATRGTAIRMLSMAQSLLRGRLPITVAEARLRRAANLPDPPDDRG